MAVMDGRSGLQLTAGASESEQKEVVGVDMNLPRVLSPNLGCPQIVSPESLQGAGVDIVLAGGEEVPDWKAFQLEAVPSYDGEGRRFALLPSDQEELEDDGLPSRIDDVSQTRFLVSTTLRSTIFKGKARFWRVRIRPKEALGEANLRRAGGSARPTLYDLVLLQGGRSLHRVSHALCLRAPSREVRFIHLTDLHVAERNDLLAQEVNSTVNPKPGGDSLRCLNFNDRLREFIAKANSLADAGKLDFVLALGDLIDFVNHGITQSESGDNNWHVWIDIVTGGSDEAACGNAGLRVPLFTTLGNHDWRPFPYPPEFNAPIFGLTKKQAEAFDYLYADTSEAVGARIAEVHSKLISEGSPILARSWWGSTVGLGMRWAEVALDRIGTRFLAFAKKSLVGTLVGTSAVSAGAAWAMVRVFMPDRAQTLLNWLNDLTKSKHFRVELVTALVLAGALVYLFRNWVVGQLREKIISLISIESDVAGLHDYFLEINPYFNYAFRLEDCYFVIMDSGQDCLTAQSFWDNGGKKIQHLKVRDNIIGGSPESMGFFPPNEYYPYSQIAWLEATLDCIRRTHHQAPGADRHCRIVVGLHAPPANLSARERKKADELLRSQGGPVLLRRGWLKGFDIHYGTLNHYISEFFYIGLGYRQSALHKPAGPGVDIVLSGHVHWNIEFQLRQPAGAAGASAWNPEVHYGEFSTQVEQHKGRPNHWWGPLLLQTAACGPPSETDSQNPYFRYITIDENLAIRTLAPQHL